MKSLMAVIVLALSLNLFASDNIYGAKLVNKTNFLGPLNLWISFECVSGESNEECEVFQAFEGSDDRFEPLGNTFTKNDFKRFAKKANSEMQKKILRGYKFAATIGTQLGHEAGETYVLGPTGRAVLVGAGVAVDVVKAPAVGVAFVGTEIVHGVDGYLHMKRLIGLLANSNKNNKEKRITFAHYQALVCALSEGQSSDCEDEEKINK